MYKGQWKGEKGLLLILIGLGISRVTMGPTYVMRNCGL